MSLSSSKAGLYSKLFEETSSDKPLYELRMAVEKEDSDLSSSTGDLHQHRREHDRLGNMWNQGPSRPCLRYLKPCRLAPGRRLDVLFRLLEFGVWGVGFHHEHSELHVFFSLPSAAVVPFHQTERKA